MRRLNLSPLEHHTQWHPLSDHKANSASKTAFVISATMWSSNVILSLSPPVVQGAHSKQNSISKTSSFYLVSIWKCPTNIPGFLLEPKSQHLFLVSLETQQIPLRRMSAFYWVHDTGVRRLEWVLESHGRCVCWKFLTGTFLSGTLLTTVGPEQFKSPQIMLDLTNMAVFL